MKYKGNIEITKENQKEWEKKLKKITSVGGDLYVHSNVKFPKLTSVGGYLNVHSNVKLDVPKLTSVGGDLYVHSNVKFPKLTSVGGYLSVYRNVKLDVPKLTSVGGDLYVHSNVKFPKLTSVGGDLYVYRKLNVETEKRLWKHNKKKRWYVSEKCSDWLLSQKGDFVYRIKSIKFKKELFDKVRKDKLSPEEVFAIENIEQRRIAYEFMDKRKMKKLKHKVLDKKKDKYGNIMKVISFNIRGYDNPFKFLHCVCPSTKREYFLETQQDKCKSAKAKSFGLDEIKFKEEW